ncbi:MAG TPA: hypothetical protein PKX69_08105 [Limnochordia bacterium]|nr:hypothetical protein [Bacillota bacterium]HOK32031.1 hypothetical protein [Limnochordia bacterium]HOL99694.1 hypothetical protein [Limnochordia bacterium]HPP72928.1 hypothetical protein [Limnochordia bacterium]HPU65201.1 hypothetical protein [Limnochordia bacterium]
MQYSNYLAQMAALIKQNPSITVREIAAQLKFADSKSVYYWLEKGNIRGINEFKRLVLGEESALPSPFSVEIGGKAHYLVCLPLFSWNPRQKKPMGEWFYLHSHPQPQGLFAISVGTNEYSPWFLANDVLIICEAAVPEKGQWMLFKTEQRFLIGKVIDGHVLEPNTLQHYPATLTRVGAIITQHRRY